jgi:hypothetical protein
MVFEPILREFYQERDVVMEERRLRYDNSPQGFLFEELLKTGAKISVLEIWGLIAKKLSDAGVKEIRYRDYYKPIEEVLEIAGGAFIEQEKLKKGIEKALKVIENMPKIDGKKIGDI